MNEMDKVTQTNAATAKDSSDAAAHLSQQAGTLLEVVHNVNALTHGNGGPPARTVQAEANLQIPPAGPAPGGLERNF